MEWQKSKTERSMPASKATGQPGNKGLAEQTMHVKPLTWGTWSGPRPCSWPWCKVEAAR